MKFKGIDCRQANHLGYRKADPEKDRDISGNPVPANYVVVVRMKDCRVYEDYKSGGLVYDASEAPAIPLDYSRTNAGYGKWSRRMEMHWTCPFYVVKDGRVYRGTIRRHAKPEGVNGINYKY